MSTAHALPQSVIDAPQETGGEREDVRLWIERLLADGLIQYLEVHHVLSSGDEDRVGAIPGPQDKGLSPSLLADTLCRMIQEDADHWGGEQEYWVYCYRNDDDPNFALFRGQYQRRCRFRFFGKGPARMTATDIERGLEQCHAALAFRHTERMGELAISATEKMRAVDEREKKRLQSRIEWLEEREDRVRKQLADEQLAVKQKEVELLKAKREDRIHEFGYNFLQLAAPAALSKMLPQGSGAGSGQEPLEGSKLREFFGELSPNQIKRIVVEAQLNPAQLLAFDTIREAYAAGKSPAFGDPLVERLFVGEGTCLAYEQWQAIERCLRPEQVKLLEPVILAYQQRAATAQSKGDVPP